MGSLNNLIKLQSYSFSKRLLLYSPYVLLPIALITLYIYPLSPFSSDQLPSANHVIISPSPPPPNSQERGKIVTEESCDYSNGKWVRTKLEPLYNGTTCGTIKSGQNCMVFGRPDKDYLYWRWQPRKCKLSRFEPNTFLKLLENKHIAFVGDSMARNQLESLLCMISTVSKPNLYYTEGEENRFRKWHFPSHNINASIYWSPFLVKGFEKKNEVELNFNTLYLDAVDEKWAGDLGHIDMLVLSIGHWYLHSAVYHYGDKVLGCHYRENCTEIELHDVYGKALKTTLQTVIERKAKGPKRDTFTMFLITFSPAHFEGEWDKLGACPKTKPFEENEMQLGGMNAEMRNVGIHQVKVAKMKAKEYGGMRVEALDISKLALLRPDGHPGPYMNPFPFADGVAERVPNDCVHWCLPGAIDTWNEILLDVLKRSEGEYLQSRRMKDFLF